MEKENNNLLVAIVGILVLLGGLFFWTKAEDFSEMPARPIIIGGLAPLSGDSAALGESDQRAKELAVEEINTAGGVNGRSLEIVWEDGKCSSENATTATQKLLNIDQVKVILSGPCSDETIAAAALTEVARVVLLTSSSTSPEITDAGDFVYRMYPSEAVVGTMLATYSATELKSKKAAIISENTNSVQDSRKAFVQSFIDSKNNVVFDESFESGTTDFRSLLVKMRVSAPDVVYVDTASIESTTLILKQMKEFGIRVLVVANEIILDREMVAKSPMLYEGVVFSTAVFDETNEKTVAFLAVYTAKYGTEPVNLFAAIAAYDSVYLLAEAMEAMDGEDPEKISTYFNDSVHDWQGLMGTFNFDDNGDAVTEFEIRKIVKGIITDLDKVTVE